MKLNCLLLLLAVTFAACDEPKYIIPPTTKIADESTKAALIAVGDDGSLTFSKSTDVLDSLEVGDILNSDITQVAPYGLLRKITAISRSGGQVTLQTEQGTLGEAIERGSFEFTKILTADDFASPRVGNSNVLPTTMVPSLSFANGIVLTFNDFESNFSSAGDAGVTGTIGINGHMRFNPIFYMNGDITFFHLNSFETSLQFEGDSDLEISMALSGGIDESTEVASIMLAVISVPIGPFVIILTPEIHITVGVAGSVGVSLSFHETGSYDGLCGTRYSDGAGWTSLNHANSSGSIDDFPTGGFSAELDAYVGVGADVLLYKVASTGPVFTIKAGPSLDFATPRDPFLQAGLRIVADLSLHLYALGHEFGSVSLAQYNELFPIYSSPNQPPILGITSPGNGLTFGASTPIHFTAAVYDLEDGTGVSVTWTSNLDGVIGTGSDFTATLHATAPGPRTITVTAVDSAGMPTELSFQLTLTNPGPVAIIAEPRATQSLYTYESVVRGSATSPFFPGVDTCSAGFAFQWSSTGPDTIGPVHCSLGTARATITYSGAGPRVVSLRVTDPFGVPTTTNRNVNVGDPPAATFFGSSNFSSPAASSTVSSTSTVLINGTADPRKVITDPLPFPVAAPLTFTFSATSYAADGVTELATIDIGSKVDIDKLTAGTGVSPPIAWVPASTPGFIDPTIAALTGGQHVVLSFTAIDAIGHYGTTQLPIQVTP